MRIVMRIVITFLISAEMSAFHIHFYGRTLLPVLFPGIGFQLSLDDDLLTFAEVFSDEFGGMPKSHAVQEQFGFFFFECIGPGDAKPAVFQIAFG